MLGGKVYIDITGKSRGMSKEGLKGEYPIGLANPSDFKTIKGRCVHNYSTFEVGQQGTFHSGDPVEFVGEVVAVGTGLYLFSARKISSWEYHRLAPFGAYPLVVIRTASGRRAFFREECTKLL